MNGGSILLKLVNYGGMFFQSDIHGGSSAAKVKYNRIKHKKMNKVTETATKHDQQQSKIAK